MGLQAAGGAGLGLLGGWLCIRSMRAIDDYAVEVALSLGVAMGVYAMAAQVHVSGPIAVVVAGLMVGSSGFKTAMSDTTQRYVRGFWTLIDELLNALLFLMLGLELLVVSIDPRQAGLWAGAIALVLAARVAVVLPWGAWFRFREAERGAGLILAWGGLHGALSLALALTLPAGQPRDLLLPMTFAVVIFSVVVQGLTFGTLATWLMRTPTVSRPWVIGSVRPAFRPGSIAQQGQPVAWSVHASVAPTLHDSLERVSVAAWPDSMGRRRWGSDAGDDQGRISAGQGLHQDGLPRAQQGALRLGRGPRPGGQGRSGPQFSP